MSILKCGFNLELQIQLLVIRTRKLENLNEVIIRLNLYIKPYVLLLVRSVSVQKTRITFICECNLTVIYFGILF